MALTLLGFGRGWLRREACLLERPPFEVLLVAPTLDASLVTLLASWFALITLQSLRLAGDAT